MAASFSFRSFCVFRLPCTRHFFKSDTVINAEIRSICALSKCLTVMHNNMDSNLFFHNYRSRRHIFSLPNVAVVNTVGKRLHNQDAVLERTCWKCGKSTDPYLELFFCKCGVVQTPADINFFEMMGLEESFDVDVTHLSQMMIELQKRLHPDKFSNKSETEKELAEKQSSMINKAYTTLSKPLSRAVYLLELHDVPIKEKEEMDDLEFLGEIMEMNETLAEAPGKDEVQVLEQKVSEHLNFTLEKISNAFSCEDYLAAKPYVIKYQYYVNVSDKIKQYYRGLMT